jgi:alpha-tubulin suppressor-like RCC1 family protein
MTSIICAGSNSYGQLGLGNAFNLYKEYYHVDFFDKLGVRIAQVHCGAKTTFFLTDDAQIYSCGANHYGQCGLVYFLISH